MSDTPAFDLWKAAGDVVRVLEGLTPLQTRDTPNALMEVLYSLIGAWAAFDPFSAFPQSEALTLTQAAAFTRSLGHPRTTGTLRKAIARGLLSGKKVGRDWTVSTQDLIEYLKQPAPEDAPAEPI